MSQDRRVQLMAMDELAATIEGMHRREPQRQTLAKVYLDSIAWGAKGLHDLGQTLGFSIVGPWEPIEFPKVLYRGRHTEIVHNANQQRRLEAEGWRERIHGPDPEPAPEPTPRVEAPTIQIPKPGVPRGPKPNTAKASD
jgi:hypothetical protein